MAHRLFAALLITAMAAASGARAQETTSTVRPSKTRLTADELAIWNDASFQRQFALSYIAETDIEPRVTLLERETLEEVMKLIAADDLDKAAQLLEKRLGEKKRPDRPERKSLFGSPRENDESDESVSAVFDYTLANVYFQQEKLDKAAAAYQAAVAKHPKFRRAWKNLGMILVRQGEFSKALPALTRVLELGGCDALSYGLLGFAYASTDNHLAAESAYRMAILLDTATLDWKMGLARSLFKQRRFAEAVALCDELLKTQPDKADLWMLQASAYVGMNQPLKAAEIYEIIGQLGKATGESLNMLGDIYVNEKLYDMAVSTYMQAMEKQEKGTADRFVRAAKVLTANGALDPAQRLIERIESHYAGQLKAEEQKDLLKLRARIAVARGSDAEEVRILEQIVELDPLDGEALILLGQHSGRTGNVEKAVFYYERAAAIENFEADAKVRHAQLLAGQGKYKEALPLLRRAQEIKPRDNVQKYLDQIERVAKTR